MKCILCGKLNGPIIFFKDPIECCSCTEADYAVVKLFLHKMFGREVTE